MSDKAPDAASQTRVVVVGAGFAGVAAAAALREGGVEDVVVLEAQERAGGRVKTVAFDGGFVELGAQFIHGEKGNHLYDLAKKYGCLMDRSLYQTNRTSDSSALDYKDHLFFTSAGHQVDQDCLVPLLEDANELTHNLADSIYNDRDCDARQENVHKNFLSFLEEAHAKFMSSSTVNVDPDVKDAVFRWIEAWQYADNGARFEDISLEGYGKYRYLEGFGLTLTNSGLMEVFNRFLQESLRPGSLRLSTSVRTVSWHPNTDKNGSPGLKVQQCAEDIQETEMEPANQRRVKVVCQNGDVILADHVIVTASIGFLRENEESFFMPPLPEEHRKAIHGVGFGLVAKVFLVWDSLEKIFGSNLEGIQFLWLKGFPPKLSSSKTSLRTSKGGNWYDNLQGFERIASHEGMMLTWLAGEEAEIMEQLPEKEIQDVLHELLVIFTNNTAIPPPKKILRSTWKSNPFTRGSYSYLAAGVDINLHDTLRQPVPTPENPVVLLAGEACSQYYFSTVHGAIESGQQAARAILRHVQSQQQPAAPSRKATVIAHVA